MPSKPTPDKFLNIKEVAVLIGLDWTTIRDGKCETKEIPRIKLGGRLLFSLNAVQEWMAAKAKKAEQDQSREQTAVIDLFSRSQGERRFIRGAVESLVRDERRKWER